MSTSPAILDAPFQAPAQVNSRDALVKALSGRFGLLFLDSMTGILCARALGPGGRGELAAMILWPVFLCQAFTFGIPTALIYRLRSKPEESSSSIAGALILALATSILGIGFGVLVLPHWLHHYSPSIVTHAKWFMLAAPLSMAVLILRSIWESSAEFGKSALSLVFTRILTLIALLCLIATHSLTSISAAYTYLLTGIPAVLWMLAAILPRATWHVRRIVVSIRPMIVYGLRSYGIDLCGALSQYIDQALVLGMLSAVEMGSYTVCLSLSRILTTLAIAASTVLFPRTIGVSPRQAVLIALRTQVAVTVLAGIGATAMLLLGTAALRILYGAQYAAASSLLKILILEALLSGALNIMSQPFMALGRPGVITLLQIAGLAFSIPAILVMVPRFGTAGACVALVLSAALRLCLLAFCYRRYLPGVVQWRADTMNIVRELAARATQRMRVAA
jgi:O-antigen/teichoic acid export membrane protein